MNFAAMYCLYDDYEYLDISLESFKNIDKVLFLISDVPWNGGKDQISHTNTINHVKNLCDKNSNYELITGHWTNEVDQRNYGLSKLAKENYEYTFIVDNDEIYHDYHVESIKKFILSNTKYSAFHIEWNTYWNKDYYVINPRENFNPLIVVKTSEFLFTGIRLGITSVKRAGSVILRTNDNDYNGILIPSNIAICYHLSYARTDDFIKRKLETNSHASEFINSWYENVWKKWTPSMQNLHPVTPEQYKIAVKEDFVAFPVQLQRFIKKEKCKKCSIIVLNWNSCELLIKCLKLIEENTKNINYEVIIVDNGSNVDNSIDFLKTLNKDSYSFPFKIVYNKENLGFPGGMNAGIKAADPNSDICLLNVDAEVQKGWLNNLYDTMINTPNCGLVGPLGNEKDYQQENMVKTDTIVPNLHFFCVLIFRELINRIGLLDTRYGIGEYEDQDYCIRARLAHYSVCISAKSLVKHKSHQVFQLNNMDYNDLLEKNRIVFLEKFVSNMLIYSDFFDFYFNIDLNKSTGLIVTK